MEYIDIDCAKPDYLREQRRGYSEAVLCECKTPKQIIEIFNAFKLSGQNVLGTRATRAQFNELKKEVADVHYDRESRTITLIQKPVEQLGLVAVCTGGTGDIPVAQEAAATAEFYGSKVQRHYDVGIAGIHRLIDRLEVIKKANVIIAVAGMEGAIGGVIAGMVDSPVIAVPTSVGYGANFGGISALLTILNSCAEGITAVNIDNGFGAGYSANQINRKIELAKREKS